MAEPLVANAADPKDVERAKRRQKTTAKDRRKAWRAVMETREGRLVIGDVLATAGVIFADFTFDERALVLARDAGRREVGQFVVQQINAAGDTLLFQMMGERMRLEKAAEQEDEAFHAAREAEREEVVSD